MFFHWLNFGGAGSLPDFIQREGHEGDLFDFAFLPALQQTGEALVLLAVGQV